MTAGSTRVLKPRPVQRALAQPRALLATFAPTASDEERHDFARAFCCAVLSEWWNAGVDKDHPVATPPTVGDLSEDARSQTHALAVELAATSPDYAAYLLTTLYAGLLPEKKRSDEGVFYTPPALVERLLSLSEEAGVCWAGHRVLDPAAGGGAFLTAVAVRMSAALKAKGASDREVLSHITTHLRGVELDSFSAWMSHVFIEAVLWRTCSTLGQRLPVLVQVRDALDLPDQWEGGYDLIIGNPPYGRVTLAPSSRARYAASLYGHANLYGVFTELAVRLARQGGVIAFVTPASFLGGQYFKRLRGLLTREAPPVFIEFITDRGGVFDTVLQETVLVAFSRGNHASQIHVRSDSPTSLFSKCVATDIGHVALPRPSEAPWILPRSRRDAALLDQVREMPHRLSDYGLRVSTGPLVWNRHKAQLTTVKAQGCYPLLWAESVMSGGIFRFRSERRNHQPFFHLLPGQSHLLIGVPVILLQRTTAKEQNKRLVAAVLPQEFLDEHGGVVVENHLNMIRPVGVRARVPLDAVAALLNSEVVDAVFRCMNGSVAVSAYELESLPLPPPESMHQLHGLLERRSSQSSVEAILRDWYGQPAEAAA